MFWKLIEAHSEELLALSTEMMHRVMDSTQIVSSINGLPTILSLPKKNLPYPSYLSNAHLNMNTSSHNNLYSLSSSPTTIKNPENFTLSLSSLIRKIGAR